VKRGASLASIASLAFAGLAGCDGRRHDPAPASAGPTASAIVAPPALSTAPAAPPADPDEALLVGARILELTPAAGPMVRPGTFDAILGAGGRRAARLEVAQRADPVAFKKPLAVARLARALGMRVVPAAAIRRIGAGELSTLLASAPGARPILEQARVQNDGTVDALLTLRPEGDLTMIDPGAGPEVATWDRWARSPDPAPGEDPGLLRDYVEMIALDYLSADVARRNAWRAGPRIVLGANTGAFPPRADGPSLDRLLRRLSAVARFPRGLRGALQRFDRERAAAVLAAGDFEDRLLSPRALVELDERRAGLLTLIEARVGQRGADAVLSL
jgi:hypothetical protein